MNQITELGKAALGRFKRHRAPRMAAALAYYTLFSLAPVLVLLVAMASVVVSTDTARDRLLSPIEEVAGSEIADTVGGLVSARTDGDSGSGWLASIVGVGLLFAAASGVFLHLQESLNTVWEVPIEETTGMMPAVWKRLKGFAAIVGLGSGLILFTAGAGLVALFADEIEGWLPSAGLAIQFLNPLIALGGVTLVFALTYRFLPGEPPSWRTSVHGALVTTILVGLGGLVIGMLFSIVNPGASFGRFAAIVILLVYVYYLAQAFLLGAEVTAELEARRAT